MGEGLTLQCPSIWGILRDCTYTSLITACAACMIQTRLCMWEVCIRAILKLTLLDMAPGFPAYVPASILVLYQRLPSVDSLLSLI
jgi:hypothetical protein